MLREALALSATLEAPLQNIWLPGYLRLGRAGVERGIGSILTGRGGDEWLTMFPVVAADLLRSFEVRELFAHTVAAVRASRVHSYRALRSTLWDSGARELLRATRAALVARLAKGAQARRATASLQRRRQRSPWLLPDPALRRVIDRRLRVRLEEGLREPGLPRDGFRHEVIAGMLDNPLFAPSFEESYEQSRLAGAMHHDIYWDPELIEFLYRVPPRLLNRGGQQKGLVRHDIAARFPGLGFERQKKLRAREFVDEVLLTEAGIAWNELGGLQALGDLGIVDPGRLDTDVRGVLEQNDTRRLGDIWQLLRLESWVRPRV
jgi:hypothetical protein